MSTSAPPLGALRASRPFPERTGPTGSLIYRLITTTDQKVIGIMYVVACFTFFFVGGLMALLIRGELAAPGLQLHYPHMIERMRSEAHVQRVRANTR